MTDNELDSFLEESAGAAPAATSDSDLDSFLESKEGSTDTYDASRIAELEKKRDEISRSAGRGGIMGASVSGSVELAKINDQIATLKKNRLDDENRTFSFSGGSLKDMEVFEDGNGEAFAFDYEKMKKGEDPRIPISMAEYRSIIGKADDWQPGEQFVSKDKMLEDKKGRDAENARKSGNRSASKYFKERFGKAKGRVDVPAEFLPAIVDEESKPELERLNAAEGRNIEHVDLPMHVVRDGNGKIAGYMTTNSTVVPESDTLFDPEGKGHYSVIPTIRGTQGHTVEMTEDEAREYYRLHSGKKFGTFASKEEAEKAAQDIHDLHQRIYRQKWNQYLNEHWDEASDEIKADPGTAAAHMKWIEAGSPMVSYDAEKERERIRLAEEETKAARQKRKEELEFRKKRGTLNESESKELAWLSGEKRERSIAEDTRWNLQAETGERNDSTAHAIAAYILPGYKDVLAERARSDQTRYERYLDGEYSEGDLKFDPELASVVHNTLGGEEAKKDAVRHYGYEMLANVNRAKDEAKASLQNTKLSWYKRPVTGGIQNTGYTLNFALSQMIGGGVGGILIPATIAAHNRYGTLTSNEYGFGENGELIISELADSATEAGAKAIVGGLAEAAVERYLEVLGVPIAKSALAKTVRGKVMRRLAEASVSGNKVARTIPSIVRGYGKLAKCTGLNSAPWEVLEEDAQAILDEVIGLDNRRDSRSGLVNGGDVAKAWSGSDQLSWKGQLDVFLSMLGTMAFQAGVGGVIDHYVNKDARNELKKHAETIYDLPIDRKYADAMSDREKAKFVSIYNKYANNPDKLAEAADRMFGKNGVLDIALRNVQARGNAEAASALAEVGEQPAKFAIPTNEKGEVVFVPQVIFDSATGKRVDGKMALDNANNIGIVDCGNGRFIVVDFDNGKQYSHSSLKDAKDAADGIILARQVGAKQAEMGVAPQGAETSENGPTDAPVAEGTNSQPEAAKPVETAVDASLANKRAELKKRLENGETDTPEVLNLISEIAAIQNTESVVKKVKTTNGELTIRQEQTDEGENYYRAYDENGEDVASFFTMDEMNGWLKENGAETDINENPAKVDEETAGKPEIALKKPVETDETAQDTESLEPAKDENASPTTRSGRPISEANILEKVTHNAPVQNVKVADLNPMGAVKQMKQDADTKTGVVNPIKGEPMDLLSNPIVVLRRKDGSMHVVTGRHRLDLYKRSGRDTIPARVINESDGWSLDDAHFIDALSNIVDGQGSVKDYVDFFNEFNPTDEQAKGFGFTRKGTKANKAFRLFRGLSPVLRSFIDWRGEGDQKLISVDDAAIIAEAVPYDGNPKNEQAHMDAIAEAVGNNLHGERLRLYVRGQAQMRNRKATTQQGIDQGGFDFGGPKLSDAEEEAIRTAENNYIADKVAQLKDTRARIERVVNGKDKGKLEISDKYAKELGITDKNDEEQLKNAINEIDRQIAYWSAEVLGSDQKAEMKKALGFALGDESTWDEARKRLAKEIKRIEVREENKKTLFDVAAENGTIPANEEPKTKTQKKTDGKAPKPPQGSGEDGDAAQSRRNGGDNLGAEENSVPVDSEITQEERDQQANDYNALTGQRVGANEVGKKIDEGIPVSSIIMRDLTRDDKVSWPVTGLKVRNNTDVAKLFQMLYRPDVERVKVLYVDKNGNVLGGVALDLGMARQSSLKKSGKDYDFVAKAPKGTAKIILSHNHPTGNVTPSTEDVAWTKQAIKHIGSRYEFDHIITNTDRYYLFSDGKEHRAKIVSDNANRNAVAYDERFDVDDVGKIVSFASTHTKKHILVGMDAKGKVNGVVAFTNESDVRGLIQQIGPSTYYAIGIGESDLDSNKLLAAMDALSGNDERGNPDAEIVYIYRNGELAAGIAETRNGKGRELLKRMTAKNTEKKPTAEKSSVAPQAETPSPDAASDSVANAPDLKFMRLTGKDGGNVVIYGKGTFNAKDKIKALGATAWSVNRKFIGWILDRSQVKAGTKLAELADANGVDAAKAYEVITDNANAEREERKAQREAERAESKKDAEREKFQRRSDEAVSDDDARKEAEDIDFAEPKEFPAHDSILFEPKTADESPAAKREAFGRKRVNDFLCAKNADGSYVHSDPSFAAFVKWMDGLLGAKAEQARRFYASWYTAGSVDAPPDRTLTDTAQVAREHNAVMGLANRGKDGIGHRVANVVQEGLMPKPQTIVNAQSYDGGLDSDQQLGVNLALTALKDGNFILADDTGFGKTRQILAIADQFRKANKDANVLILTENEQILAGSFADDSRAMGINLNDFTTGTYTALGDGKFDGKKWDLVILDEAHNVANVLSARGGNFAKMDAAHVVFSTATPMDKPTDADYFISRVLGIPRETVADMIGYRYVEGKYGVYPVPVQGTDENMILRNLIALRNRMIADGRYVRREYPFLGSFEEQQAELTQQHAEAESGSNAYWDYMADRKKIARYPFVQRIEDENEREKMIEQIRKSALQQKVKNADVLNEHYMALSAVNEALTELKKNPNAAIVIVGEQVNDRFLTGAKSGSRTQMDVPLRPSGTDSKGRTLYRVDGSLPLIIRELEKAGYGNKIVKLFGANKKGKTQAIADFNNGTKNILVMTKKSGGTGVNLDDRFGNRPRTVYLLSPEYSAKVAHQLQGRFSRKPTMSNTRMVMFANPSYSYSHRNRVAGSKVAALNAITSGADSAIVEGREAIGNEEFFETKHLYTGSAADYEKPSLHHVGTGEGSQVYGWGLYASSERGVAEAYADATARKFDNVKSYYKGVESSEVKDGRAQLPMVYIEQRGGVENAIKYLKDFLSNNPQATVARKALDQLEKNKSDYEYKIGSKNVYEQTFFTNRAPGDESHLLKWYEPVSEENWKRIESQAKKEGFDLDAWMKASDPQMKPEQFTGEQIYSVVANMVKNSMWNGERIWGRGDPKVASEFLARADIDGIKYPVDSYGKTVKDGDKAGWNYVSFRDDNIRVDHKWRDGEMLFEPKTDPLARRASAQAVFDYARRNNDPSVVEDVIEANLRDLGFFESKIPIYEGLTDSALVKKAKTDDYAFNVLVKRHESDLKNYARRHARSWADAEDIYQNAMMSLSRQAKKGAEWLTNTKTSGGFESAALATVKRASSDYYSKAFHDRERLTLDAPVGRDSERTSLDYVSNDQAMADSPEYAAEFIGNADRAFEDALEDRTGERSEVRKAKISKLRDFARELPDEAGRLLNEIVDTIDTTGSGYDEAMKSISDRKLKVIGYGQTIDMWKRFKDALKNWSTKFVDAEINRLHNLPREERGSLALDPKSAMTPELRGLCNLVDSGLSVDEIANRVGKPKNTIYANLRQARIRYGWIPASEKTHEVKKAEKKVDAKVGEALTQMTLFEHKAALYEPKAAPTDLMERNGWRREWYMKNIADRRHPILSLVRDVVKRGGMLPGRNPYYEYRTRVTGIKANLMHQIDVQQEKADALFRKYAGKITPYDVGVYLLAKATPARNAKIKKRNGKLEGAGWSDSDAQNALAQFAADGKLPILREFDAIVKNLRDNYGLDYLVNAGMLDAKTAAALKAEEPDYVPFRTDFTSEDGFDLNSVSRIEPPTLKTAYGREDMADNPLVFLFMQARDNVTRGEENKAREAFAQFVDLNPEVGIVRKQKLRGAYDFKTGNKALVTDERDREKDNKNLIVVKRGGKNAYVELYGKRGAEVAEAIRGDENAYGPKLIQAITRFWAGTATQYSPIGFRINNAIKDAFEVATSIEGDHGPIAQAKYLALRETAFANGMAATLKQYLKDGTFGGKYGVKLKEWVENGGLIGGGVRQGYEKIESELDEAARIAKGFAKSSADAKRIVKALGDKISYWNEMTENLSRFINFYVRREAGEDVLSAVIASREDGTDFNMYGKQRWMNSVWMFANSITGGAMRHARQLARHPFAIGGELVVLGIVEGLADALTGGDDPDEEKNVTEYERANNLYFRLGNGEYVRIPMHMGPYSWIKYVGNNAARAMLGKIGWDEAAKNILVNAATIATHFSGAGEIALNVEGDVGDFLQSAALSLVPVAPLQTAAQLALNEDYKQTPIRRDHPWDEFSPNWQFPKSNTPEFFIAAARFLSNISGGDEGTAGWLNLAPEDIKYFSDQVLKNTGKDIYQTAMTIAGGVAGAFDAMRREDKPRKRLSVNDTPVVNRLLRSVPDNSRRFYEARDFFDAQKKAKKNYEGANSLKQFDVELRLGGARAIKEADDILKAVKKSDDSWRKSQLSVERDYYELERRVNRDRFLKIIEPVMYPNREKKQER